MHNGLIEDINTKYVFDSISFRDIYNPKNTNKLNSEFEIELLVVGYNPKKSYFVKFDSIVDGKKINPDTLLQTNGGFKYKTTLNEKEKEIWIEMSIDNKYGKNREGTLHEKIRVQD